MPQRLESFPLGLREVLGRGNPPPRFTFHPENLLPQLDIEKYLLLQSRTVESLGENVSAVGIGAEITVPDGEFWYVFSCHASTDILDADQTMEMAITVRVQGGTFAYDRIRTTRFSNWFQGAPGSLILRPNDAVLVGISEITVGAAGLVLVSTQVVFSRLGG